MEPLFPRHLGSALIIGRSVVCAYVSLSPHRPIGSLPGSISLAQRDLCTLTLLVDASELIFILLLQDSSPTGKINTSYWMYLSDQN